MSPYEGGYFAARAGFLEIINPWFWPSCIKQHQAWALGYADARQDRLPPSCPRLQAEFEEVGE